MIPYLGNWMVELQMVVERAGRSVLLQKGLNINRHGVNESGHTVNGPYAVNCVR
jgi:hypothetical protein